MLNRDMPLGQRFGDGYYFGLPPIRLPRARSAYDPTECRSRYGWLDRAGQGHGRSGDKLARRANAGTLTLNGSRRGPYDGLTHRHPYPFSAKRG